MQTEDKHDESPLLLLIYLFGKSLLSCLADVETVKAAKNGMFAVLNSASDF